VGRGLQVYIIKNAHERQQKKVIYKIGSGGERVLLFLRKMRKLGGGVKEGRDVILLIELPGGSLSPFKKGVVSL